MISELEIEKLLNTVQFRCIRELGMSIANIKAIANLTMTQRAIVLERLMKHGRVDNRARDLIKAYIADSRVDFSQEECDHIIWGMGHLIEADDADIDSRTGAMIMMRYCIDGASDEIKDQFLHKMVVEEL